MGEQRLVVLLVSWMGDRPTSALGRPEREKPSRKGAGTRLTEASKGFQGSRGKALVGRENKERGLRNLGRAKSSWAVQPLAAFRTSRRGRSLVNRPLPERARRASACNGPFRL